MKLPLLFSQSNLMSFRYSVGATMMQMAIGSMKYSALSLSGASEALSMSIIFYVYDIVYVLPPDFAFVGHCRGRQDCIDLEIVLQPLPEDVHVQHPQKTAAETWAQSSTTRTSEGHRRISQHQFCQTISTHVYFFSRMGKSSVETG